MEDDNSKTRQIKPESEWKKKLFFRDGAQLQVHSIESSVTEMLTGHKFTRISALFGIHAFHTHKIMPDWATVNIFFYQKNVHAKLSVIAYEHQTFIYNAFLSSQLFSCVFFFCV